MPTELFPLVTGRMFADAIRRGRTEGNAVRDGITAAMRLAAGTPKVLTLLDIARARRTGALLCNPAEHVRDVIEANMERGHGYGKGSAARRKAQSITINQK